MSTPTRRDTINALMDGIAYQATCQRNSAQVDVSALLDNIAWQTALIERIARMTEEEYAAERAECARYSSPVAHALAMVQ